MDEFRKTLFRPVVTDLTHSRILRLFTLLLIVATIPLTVFVAGQTQDTRNLANVTIIPIFGSDNQVLDLSGEGSVSKWLSNNSSSTTLDLSHDYTIETWFKSTDNRTSQTNRFLMYAPGTNGFIYLAVPGVTFYVGYGGYVTANVYVTDGNWHHIAGVKNGTKLALYIDGVKVPDLQPSPAPICAPPAAWGYTKDTDPNWWSKIPRLSPSAKSSPPSPSATQPYRTPEGYIYVASTLCLDVSAKPTPGPCSTTNPGSIITVQWPAVPGPGHIAADYLPQIYGGYLNSVNSIPGGPGGLSRDCSLPINGTFFTTPSDPTTVPAVLPSYSQISNMSVGSSGSGDSDINAEENLGGYVDEMRISNVARYTGNFSTQTSIFTKDNNTLLLNHFDNNSGGIVSDSSDSHFDGKLEGGATLIRSTVTVPGITTTPLLTPTPTSATTSTPTPVCERPSPPTGCYYDNSSTCSRNLICPLPTPTSFFSPSPTPIDCQGFGRGGLCPNGYHCYVPDNACPSPGLGVPICDTIGVCLPNDASPTVVPPTITTVPSSDNDGDGFTNAVEQYIGTNPQRACPTNTSDAAWPPDFNNNTTVTILDFGKLRNALINYNNGTYDRRYDLNGDGSISIDDYNLFVPYFGTSCTSPSPTAKPRRF